MRIGFFILTTLLYQSSVVFSQTIYASGTVRYYDSQLQIWKPLTGVEVKQLNGTPSYTDANGRYSVPVGANWIVPDQVTVYVFFRNQYIDLRGAVTTRSDSRTAFKEINPPPFYLPGDEFSHMDFDFTDDWGNYAKIFDYANKAANFSIAQGFIPAKCIVKYPLQASIVNQVWIGANGSFFWPFETMSTNSVAFQAIANAYLPIIPLVATLFGYTGEMTQNAIYINDLVKYYPSTVYHEYAHFIMKQKRGDWSVSKTEYISGFPTNHDPEASQQNSRQAYLEGWANFYELAVLGWVANPSSPYSVGKYSVGHVSNGYNHELTVANAFWDFYDPVNDENFQTSYTNIFNVLGEKQNLMSEFISALAHKSYLTDAQRNAGINLMTLNKMSPITSYGNATMYAKNDFNGGIVNINGGDVNTSTLGGAFSATELWMSTYRPLLAKEQMYDNYQRLFKHTNPISPSDTWTTGDPQKKNFTETWGVYTDALTFAANFDRVCNITLAKYGLESGTTLESSVNSYRDGIPISLSAPDITQNGITYKFLNWSDGSIANPRPVTVNQHESFTANYKGHLFSSSPNATANNNQRKIAQSSNGTYFMVYESKNKIWFAKSTNGTNWTNEVVIGEDVNNQNTVRSPSLFVTGSRVAAVWYETDENTNGFGSSSVCFRFYENNSWSNTIDRISYFSPPAVGYDAAPVITSDHIGDNGNNVVVAWNEPSGIAISRKRNGNWDTVRFVPNTNGNCVRPSIVSYYYSDIYALIWENKNNESISYVEIVNNSPMQFGPQYQVSPSGWYGNQRPTIGITSDLRRVIAWQSFDNVAEGTSVHVRTKSAAGIWDNLITSFSTNSSSAPKPVVGTYLSNNKYTVAWETDGNIYSAKYNGGYWDSPMLIASGNNGGANLSSINQSSTTLLALWKKPNGSLNISSSGIHQFNIAEKINAAEEKIAAFRLNKHIIFYLDSIPSLAAKGYKGMIGFEIAGLSKQSANGNTTVDVKGKVRALNSDKFSIGANGEVLKIAAAYYAKGLVIPEKSKLTEINSLVSVSVKDAQTDETLKEVWKVPFARLANATTTDGEFRTMNIQLNGLKGKEIYLDVNIAAECEPLFVDDYYIYGTEDTKMRKFFEQSSIVPTKYVLYQNYPNPFNPTTNIKFDLVEPQYVTLKVYNSLGQEVRTVASDYYEAGSHEVQFNASSLSSGTYFYKIQTGNKLTAAKNLILLK